jgi:acetylornithine/succinyldiaminopimelate/putrescine aminotransferase
MSASSFAGNALACTAALAMIEVLKEERLVDECKKKGTFLLQRLGELKDKYSQIIKTVKGIGLLIGVQFFKPAETFEFAREMIRQGILVLPAFGNPSVLMLEPPFVIPMDQLDRLVACFHSACRKLAR